MGIPSYFSHIIRNYSNIIRSWNYIKNNNVVFDHLFMDCNSIIYDAYHSIKDQPDDVQNSIIEKVIESIHKYIKEVKPRKTVFIAFDGVAPLAKMEQQRTRRHKTSFLSNVNFDVEKSLPVKSWDTTAITPGTQFMEQLTKQLKYEFSHIEEEYKLQYIHLSCSDECGEGEHKLFEFIRNNNLSQDNIALYGLDSDLIMLSLFHLSYCSNIYIFREALEFQKGSLPVDVNADKNEIYFLDLIHLSQSIIHEMSCCDSSINRVYDYIFLCFFLGNDFLPHFPAMNIRTHGIDTLLTIYKNTLGKQHDTFIITSDMKISWYHLRKVISVVSKNEHEYLNQEYYSRKRFNKYQFEETTVADKEKLFQNTPIIYRQQEQYIAPEKKGWQNRYYKTLFHTKPDESFIRTVCNNYMEALEWVFYYYTKGCIDWRWKYNYHFPPLFSDLISFIPHFDTQFIKENDNVPYSPQTQLAYVLPLKKHDLMNPSVVSILKKYYSSFYTEDIEFQWSFCRYFWEAHPVLPYISVDLLNNLNGQIERLS